jgi:hypothetical protein
MLLWIMRQRQHQQPLSPAFIKVPLDHREEVIHEECTTHDNQVQPHKVQIGMNEK